MELSKLTLEIFSKLEQKWLSDCENTKLWSPTAREQKKTRILSIDGGGTNGATAGAALVHLEEQIKVKSGDSEARIADYFDVVAGTGIGGVFAAMLTADNGNGRPLFTARDAVRFVREKRSEMYKPAGGIFRRRRCAGKSMDRVLMEAFRGDDGEVLTLKDTCKPLLIPCYDLNSAAPFVFSRADASGSPSFDFELWKVCRATSATPSLFKPFQLTSVDGKTSCMAIDGGLVMNNPSAAVVTHVLHNKRDFPSVSGVEDLLVMSLGNGTLSDLSHRKRNGKCSTPAVVDIVLDGVSETIDQILGNSFCWNRTDYVRIQANGFVTESVEPPSDGVEAEVETVAGERMLREKGVESLPFGGKRLLTESNGERISAFAQRLVASRKALPLSPSKETGVAQLANGR